MQKKKFVLPKLSINYFNILNLLLVCFPVSIFIGTGAINLIVFLICSIGLIMFSKKIFIFKNNKTTSILFLFFLLLFLSTILDGIRYPEKNNVLKALLYFRYFILFIVISYFVKSREFNLKYFQFNQISIVLVCLTILIFEARNLNRVIKEVKIYNYKPFIETYYKIDKNYFSIQKKIDNLKNENGPFSKTVF